MVWGSAKKECLVEESIMTNLNHHQSAFAGNKVANCAEYKRCKEVVSKMANLKFEISMKKYRCSYLYKTTGICFRTPARLMHEVLAPRPGIIM